MKRLIALEVLMFMTETLVILIMDKNPVDRAWMIGVCMIWFLMDIIGGWYRGNQSLQNKRNQKLARKVDQMNLSQDEKMFYVVNLKRKQIRNATMFNQAILSNVPFPQACIRKMIRAIVMAMILVLLWRIL